MFGFGELLGLMVLAGVTWFWWTGQACKDIARRHGRVVCNGAGVQFLDDTVALNRMRLRRGHRGGLLLARRYDFEFTSDAARRYHGHIDMLGRRIEKVEMEPYRIDNPWDNASGGSDNDSGRLH